MHFLEYATLAEKVITYVLPNDLTGVVAGGIIGNRADAMRGVVGQKLWETSKKWYQKKVADLDVPVNATLQRAIRRSYLTSLVQICDESIIYIKLYEASGDEYLTAQRTILQALYHKLKRTLPMLCSFPLSDADYQIQLIEIIRTHLTTEIDKVATQDNLPSNPADAVLDQLILWDNTHTISERQLLLQDEVHSFVLAELKTTRRLDVPDALETLLRLGWLHQGEKQTFFELMCRNFSEEIKHEEGVSEIFNAKLLAMLREKMEVVLQEVRATQAGIQRMEGQLTTLPEEVADRVVAKIATIDFNLYEKHRHLNSRLATLDKDFTELNQKIQKRELKIETTEDDETRELLADTLRDLTTKRIYIDQQRTALRKELTTFEDDVCKLALSLYSEHNTDSSRLQLALTLFEKGDIEGANRALDPEDLERDKILIEKAEAFLDQKRQTLAQEYITKAKLVGLENDTPHWFSKAIHYYVEAVKLYNSFYNCFNAAYFFGCHNRHQPAVEYYELALKNEENETQRASVLNNLAALYRIMNQRTQAEEKYLEVLSIWENLASKGLESSEFFLLKIARTINNLAVLYAESGEQKKAENHFVKAFNICQSLSEYSHKLSRSFVGAILNNLGKIHIDKGQVSEAKKSYCKALKIYKELADENPQLYKSDVALILYNLGVLYFDNNQHQYAERSYERSLLIRRSLVKQNPQKYLPDLAKTISALAVLHAFSKIDKAEKEHLESITIWENLLTVSPLAFQIDYASALINLGIFYQDMVVEKVKSLDYSLRAYETVINFSTEFSQAKEICKKAEGVWRRWERDLQKHIQNKQREGK